MDRHLRSLAGALEVEVGAGRLLAASVEEGVVLGMGLRGQGGRMKGVRGEELERESRVAVVEEGRLLLCCRGGEVAGVRNRSCGLEGVGGPRGGVCLRKVEGRRSGMRLVLESLVLEGCAGFPGLEEVGVEDRRLLRCWRLCCGLGLVGAQGLGRDCRRWQKGAGL